MKKIVKLFLIIILSISMSFSPVYARAGGGASGGGSGGSSGGSSSGSFSGSSKGINHSTSKTSSNPIVYILNCVGFILLSCSTVIIIKIRLTKAKIKTKKFIKRTSWNYNEVNKRVKEAYYKIQKAWAINDIDSASEYMSLELLKSFKMKLDWMEIANKKNILKHIKLIDSYPVSVNDDIDDSKDSVWIYIKGKMVDYTINTNTNEIIDGSTINKSFVEYWLFNKNEKNQWVLCKILQEDELDTILVSH